MQKPSTRAGGDHLARRNDVTSSRKDQAGLSDILIVEDFEPDAKRLTATLHIMFGYGVGIRHAATLDKAIDSVIEKKPDVLFLDDVMPPNENAAQTIVFLRKAGYEGPIVIISDRASRLRSAQLMAMGALDAIHKDNLDTVRLGEALQRVRAAVVASRQ